MVPQLHIHHVARFKQDIAWPHPIWGYSPAKERSNSATAQLIQLAKIALQQLIND